MQHPPPYKQMRMDTWFTQLTGVTQVWLQVMVSIKFDIKILVWNSTQQHYYMYTAIVQQCTQY